MKVLYAHEYIFDSVELRSEYNRHLKKFFEEAQRIF
jgi:hypothetical protein